jgi:hypothetical protein
VSVFRNLVGERINSILLRDDNQRIVFRTIEGREFRYYTSGDCCNTVWINHVTGVSILGEGNTFDLLRGALVTGSEDKGWGPNRSDEDEWDVIQDGFFTLKTDRGYIDFEVRNSHNGYYGGSFEFDSSPENDSVEYTYTPVVEDF